MHRVKLLDVALHAENRWYVSTGNAAVGPVNLELIARGVEAGKVPLEAFVRHEEWNVWRPFTELAVVTGEEGGREIDVTDDVAEVGRPSMPSDFVPTDAFEGASDRRDALVLLMTAAVVRAGADVALVHEMANDGAFAVCGHGPEMFEALRLQAPLWDPVLLAAAAGAIVVAEPAPGPAGQAMLGRLSKLAGLVVLGGAVMFPIRPRRRLAAMLELGRRMPFRVTEIASVETLVDALVAKLEAWNGERSGGCSVRSDQR